MGLDFKCWSSGFFCIKWLSIRKTGGVKSWKSWFYNRVVKLFIPLYIYTFVALTAILLFSNEHVGLIHYIKAGGVDGLNHLWFMRAIALAYLITPLLQLTRNNPFISFVGLVIIGILEYVFIQYNLFVFSWIWLYAFGYIYALLSNRLQYSILFILGFLSLFLTFTITWNDILDYNSILNRQWHDIFGLTFCLLGIKYFATIFRFRLPYPLVWLDRNSFYIYITHHIYLLGPLTFLSFIESPYLCVFVILVLIFISTIILAFISNNVIYKLKNTSK